MASLTIRNLDDAVKKRLRIYAAEHGVSMEEAARAILRTALVSSAGPKAHGFASAVLERLGKSGAELTLPKRRATRKAPEF